MEALVSWRNQTKAWVVRAAVAGLAMGVFAGAQAAETPAPPSVMILDLTTLNGCGMAGDARKPEEQAFNRLKNRWLAPSASDWTKGVTLEAMALAGDGSSRVAWGNSKAGVIEGTCVAVRMGGVDSANCHRRGEEDRDTVLELVADPSNPASRRVTAVVTPRWRSIMGQLGQDWTTRGLRARLLGRSVRIAGWFLLETAWTIQPITQIEIVVR